MASSGVMFSIDTETGFKDAVFVTAAWGLGENVVQGAVDPGVLAFLRQAVEGAKRNGRHSGICGQAPSDYLEIAKYLVEIGIDSMSLSPDSVLKTMRAVVELEKELGRQVRQPEAA